MDIEVRFFPWLYSATTAANDVLRIGLPDCDAGVKGSLWTLKRQYHEVRIPYSWVHFTNILRLATYIPTRKAYPSSSATHSLYPPPTQAQKPTYV